MLHHCATEESWKQGFGDNAASVRMTRTQPIVTTWDGFISPNWFVWQWGARPHEPGTPKTWTTKVWKLSGIRFDLDNQERFMIRTSLHLVVDKKQQQKQQQFLTSHFACNNFTMAFHVPSFHRKFDAKEISLTCFITVSVVMTCSLLSCPIKHIIWS